MTTTFIWHDLKQLVIIDYEINRLRTTLLKKESLLKTAQVEHHKSLGLLHEIELTARTLQKEIDRSELSSRDLKAQIDRKKNQLASIMNNKERIALEHEIAKLLTSFDQVDTDILRLLEQQEAVKSSVEKQKKITSTLEVQLNAQQEEAATAATKTQAEIAELEKEWAITLEQVPALLRNDYLQLKKRVANPAAPIVSDSCSACFMNLLHTESLHLTTRSVIKCRGCFRFLYLPDATTESLQS